MAKAGIGGDAGGLVGPAAEQGGPLALEEGDGAAGLGVGLGEQGGPGDQRRQQPASEPAHPEERHRDVEPVGRADAPGIEARGRGPSAPPWVWITPLGAPRLPDVNMTARSSAGRTRGPMAATSGRERRRLRVGSSSHTQPAGWAARGGGAPDSTQLGDPREMLVELVQVASGRGSVRGR